MNTAANLQFKEWSEWNFSPAQTTDEKCFTVLNKMLCLTDVQLGPQPQDLIGVYKCSAESMCQKLNSDQQVILCYFITGASKAMTLKIKAQEVKLMKHDCSLISQAQETEQTEWN